MKSRAVSTHDACPQKCRLLAGKRVRRGAQQFALILCLISGSALIFGPASKGGAQPDAPLTLASGTRLYIRLVTAVSTMTSHLNEDVTARVVREATNGQGVLVPIGSEVTGKIEKLIPSSDPSDHARVLINFTKLAIANHAGVSLTAHLVEVENARETVLQDGTIQGILAKDAPVGRMDGLMEKLGSAGSAMEKISGKTLGKVDTSIDYPAGTDMVLVLDQPLTVDAALPSAAATQIPPAMAESIQKLLAGAPSRVENKSKKPGDPLNLVIIGGQSQILEAFKRAGWDEAKNLNRKSMTGTVRAMANDRGYEQAPVSRLYLFGRPEDLALEKMLNTFMRRHHLRLWRSGATTADGREIWLGAATHDIGIDVHLGVVSHAIDGDLDAERAKVGADLMAGGAVAAEQLVTRPNPVTEGKTATGGSWKTDGRLLAVELKSPAGM